MRGQKHIVGRAGLVARPRKWRDGAAEIDDEIGELENYLVRLQSEITDVKLKLSELRVNRRFGNRDAT